MEGFKMQRKMEKIGIAALALACMLSMGACHKKNVPVSTGDVPAGGYGAGAGAAGSGMSSGSGSPFGMDESKWRELGLYSEPERKEFLQRSQSFENDDVFFDYDSFLLSDSAKKALDAKVDFLSRYPKVNVTVEGHCDDRGTNEYNLALGERRAHSAWQYLVNSGVNQQRLSTVSYGEERPLATGETEAAWSKNRRAHFDLKY